jgi:16S rRNA (guanine527-N7)-methyltransferase
MKPRAARSDPVELLESGVAGLGATLTSLQRDQLLAYLALLQKWNRAMNLTAHEDIADMVSWHLLDSLAGLPHVVGRQWIDVGTGAGLPGIPLAIKSPDARVVLLDSRSKRCQFLIHACGELGLTNVEVVTGRAEEYRPQVKFDTLVARAFAAIPELLRCAGHLCRPLGRIVVWKGKRPGAAEMNAVPADRYSDVGIHPISVPGLGAARHLVTLTPRAAGPE